MALRGTLGDFALTDILQLIGLQRKTGLLVLRHEDEEVTVGFEGGKVVSADSSARPTELKVGQLLVRAGKLTESRLDQALKIQQETLQRLGHVLMRRGWIERETLAKNLQLQILETVYDLFRWRDGEYDFQPDRKVDWDRELVTPIPSETLLMEGAQMVDEWPIIERVIPSRAAVLRPTAAAAHVLATTTEVREARGSVYDEDLDFGFLPENPLEEEATIGQRYGERDISVLRWVDGKRTAGEIAELSGLGSFDTFKTLTHLLELRLIEVASSGAGDHRSSAALSSISGIVARSAAMAIIVLSFGGALLAFADLYEVRPGPALSWPLPPTLSPGAWLEDAFSIERSRAARSLARMERLEFAVRSFALGHGRWPSNGQELVQRGFVTAESLQDPWGEPYRIDIENAVLGISEASGHAGRTAAVWRVLLGPIEASLSQ